MRKLSYTLSVLIILLVMPQRASASVVLKYFRATAVFGGIELEWETASEVNNDGFFILRSTSAQGIYERIIFVLSESVAGEGIAYAYIDDTVTFGVTYFYKLAIVDLYGNEEIVGPVSAGYGVPTFTATIARTGSPTALSPSPSSTVTVNPYPIETTPVQGTPYPPPGGTLSLPSSTASATFTPTPSGSPLSSATLSPTSLVLLETLPTPKMEPGFDLLFPAPTQTFTPSVSPPLIVATTSAPGGENGGSFSSRTGKVLMLLSIPVVLWGGLAAFWVIFVKKALESAFFNS